MGNRKAAYFFYYLNLACICLGAVCYVAVKYRLAGNSPLAVAALYIVFFSLILILSYYFKKWFLDASGHEPSAATPFGITGQAFDALPDAACVTDAPGIIIYANGNMRSLLGHPNGAVEGTEFDGHLEKIISPSDRLPGMREKIAGLMADHDSTLKEFASREKGMQTELISYPLIAGGTFIGRAWLVRETNAASSDELAECRRKFSELFERVDDAIIVVEDGIITECNNAAVRSLKYACRDDLTGKSFRDISPGEHDDEVSANAETTELFRRAAETGSCRIERLNKRSNGEFFPVELLITPIVNMEGRMIFYVFCRDISAQKKTREELERDRAVLKTVIDNIPDAVYAKDVKYRKTLANKTDLANMGCVDENTALGKTDFDFFPKEVAEVFYNDDKKIIETGQAVINREEYFFDGKGKKNWLLTSKLPLFNEEGDITGLVGIGRNITVRKKSELIHDALYQISEAAHGASDMASLYKCIHEVVSSLMSAKNFFIAIYDEKSDLVTFPYMVDEFDPPYEPHKPGKGLTEYIMRKGEAFLIDAEKDMELRRTGEADLIGTPCAIWLGVPLKIGTKTIGVIAVQDYDSPLAYGEEEKQLLIFVSEQIAQVIERKRRAEEIIQYTEELRQINQTKDKLFSIIAHDLRSPFHPILSLAEILNDDLDTLEKAEIRQISHDIYTSALSVHTLMENLLEWSRMQTGSIQFNPVRILLKKKTDTVMQYLTENALLKKITLNNRIPMELQCKGDEQMLRSIFHNLLSNAIKFTSLEGEITVSAKIVSAFIEITVADTGVGIPPERLEKIFKVDTNISTRGTNQEKGTGLGLLICKEFIERHGGTIHIESEVGAGSKFIFTLPVWEE